MSSPESFKIPSVERRLMEKIDQRSTEGVYLNTNPISAETYRRLFKKIIHADDVVVNLGPGVAIDPSGEIIDACAEKGAILLALDIEHASLMTHNDLKEITGNTTLHPVEADAKNMPVSDESIAGIVSSNLINCPNPDISIKEQGQKLIDEAWRVLRPGGFLLLSSFGYKAVARNKSGEYVYNNDIKKADILTLKEIEMMLNKKGFVYIAELEVDSEVKEASLEYFKNRPAEEEGGFIAYKPKIKK